MKPTPANLLVLALLVSAHSQAAIDETQPLLPLDQFEVTEQLPAADVERLESAPVQILQRLRLEQEANDFEELVALVTAGTAEAIDELERRADRGNSMALLLLAAAYLDGLHRPVDDGKARVLLEASADQGNPGAMLVLGVLEMSGRLGPADIDAARRGAGWPGSRTGTTRCCWRPWPACTSSSGCPFTTTAPASS